MVGKFLILISMALLGCAEGEEFAIVKSLDNATNGSKKYYLGVGEPNAGPGIMMYEPKYDVKNISDILTNEHGGGYESKHLVESGEVSKSTIFSAQDAIKEKSTNKDMFFWHSSSHGFPRGLAIGITYEDIADFALSLPQKEIFISVMACHSGGLVDEFKSRKDEWEKFKNEGRSLIVMASSDVSSTSATGPGKDPDRPELPGGAAGSAYGHAIWKSLQGKADGVVDGIKDGFVDFAEIVAYTKKRTRQIGGHTPVHTGVYNENTVMNAVPESTSYVSWNGPTASMDDNQLRAYYKSIDASYYGCAAQ